MVKGSDLGEMTEFIFAFKMVGVPQMEFEQTISTTSITLEIYERHKMRFICVQHKISGLFFNWSLGNLQISSRLVQF